MIKEMDWNEFGLRTQESFLFDEVFSQFLTVSPGATVLEVGCAGGSFLYHIAHKYQYQAFGVDFSDQLPLTNKIFIDHNYPLPTLYKEDFLTWQPEQKFDLVMSFGFIEHFDDPRQIIKKHLDLLKPGGKLIISLPHFAHAQYLFHWLIDRDNLAKHNTKIMRLAAMRQALSGLPVKILHLSYHDTFAFWTERKGLVFWEKVVSKLIVTFGSILVKVMGEKWPNVLFSPNIICIAEKDQIE